MAVEDEDTYQDWRGALDHMIEAARRLRTAAPNEEAAARHDLAKAIAEFEKISAKI